MTPLRQALAFLLTGIVLATVGIAAPQAASAAPVVGGCFDYTARTIGKVSSAAPVIGCESTHTAETYYVGTVTEAFGPPSKSKQAMRLSAGRPCTVAAMNSYLGMPDRDLPSRFRTVVLFPTDAEWGAGERWVRCDVVLQAGTELKSFTGTAAALVASSPQAQFNFCTPGQPNALATSAVPCLNPRKNWIKVLDKELGGPASGFPGTDKVRKKTNALCKQQGKKWAGKVKYPGYWWIMPTSVGWRNGNRSAQCFVPYAQYLKQVALNTPAPPAPAPTPTPTPEPTPLAATAG
jgi:hypothetical protein